MLAENAQDEVAKVQWIRDAIERAAAAAAAAPWNVNDYFIFSTMCEIEALDAADLEGFDDFCAAGPLAHDDITAANVNDKLAEVRALQQRDGGESVYGQYFAPAVKWDGRVFYASLLDLLQNGIARLNADAGVLHNDIKEDNVVFDGTHVRLIDWDRASDAVAALENRLVAAPVNRSGAYTLNSTVFREKFMEVPARRAWSNDRLADELMSSSLIMFDEKTQDKVALRAAGVSSVRAACALQLRDMLRVFRPGGAGTALDVAAYTSLLRRNVDVYGWLYVVAYSVFAAADLFTETYAASINKNAVGAFLRKYLYTPVLSAAYDVDAIAADFRAAFKLPSSAARGVKRKMS